MQVDGLAVGSVGVEGRRGCLAREGEGGWGVV